MSVTGKIVNGSVVLPPDAHFEKGQHVEIRPAPVFPEEAFVLGETAPAFATVRNLPDDLVVNLDSYQNALCDERGCALRAPAAAGAECNRS